MPSDKKRINLTIPDDVYERIQQYREANGIMSDASACYQLIVQQLKAVDNMALLSKVIKENSMEVLLNTSAEGLTMLKGYQDKLFPTSGADKKD